MAMRKKTVIDISTVAFVFITFWVYWSPRALVGGRFSLGDSVAIRLQVRMHTIQPIVMIYRNADGSVVVNTGVLRAELDGCGYHYKLKKTQKGWEIEDAGIWQS